MRGRVMRVLYFPGEIFSEQGRISKDFTRCARWASFGGEGQEDAVGQSVNQKVNQTRSVCVLGAGSWGTALAHAFADAGARCMLWGRDKNVIDHIQNKKQNPKYLAGFPLSPSLEATTEIEEAVQSSE